MAAEMKMHVLRAMLDTRFCGWLSCEERASRPRSTRRLFRSSSIRALTYCLVASSANPLVCAPALAQATSDTRSTQAVLPATAQTSVTTPPVAAPAQSEILITARRREERLQDVPIAVTAVSSETLKQVHIENSSELTFVTPGLTMGYRGQAATPFIRGVGNSDPSTGAESPIALYVDGVYMTNVYASTLPFNNIDHVEVLKGPQGTLFGRNATGGLIQIITKDPTQNRSLDASVSYGNYNTSEISVYASGGVARNLAGDISFFYTHQGEGYGKNVVTGQDWFKTSQVALRSKWVFTPTDTTKVTLIGDYRHSNSDVAEGYAVMPGTVNFAGNTALPNFYDLQVNKNPFLHLNNGGVSLRIDQDTSLFHIMNLAAYRYSDYHLYLDDDSSPVPLIDFWGDAKTNTFSDELQLSSNRGSAIRWIGGLFYLNDNQRYVNPNCLGLYGLAFGPTPSSGVLFCNGVKVSSISAYAEATVNLAKSTELTVGGRWTSDHKTLTAQTNVVDTSGNVTVGSVSSLSKTWKSPSWRVILSQHLTENNMLYASYSRGFKSGGFNLIDITAPAYQPEQLDAFEIGSKNQFLDRKLTVNISAFYYNYRDLQLYKQEAASAIVINAASAHVKGGELEVHARPIPQWTIDAGLAYTDGHYVNFLSAPCTFPLTTGGDLATACDASGNRLNRTPKWTNDLGTTFRIPSRVGTFSATLLNYWSSSFPWEPDNRLKQKAYDVLNGNVAWTSRPGTLQVSVWAKNLLNTKYYAHALSSGTGDFYSPAPPRTYGLQLRVLY